MTRDLLILRHGKAEGPDRHRALKDKGKRQAQRIGVWLAQNQAMPTTVVASPAERALVTAQKAVKAGGREASLIRIDDRLYDATLADVLEVARGVSSEAARAMIVGHNPALTELVAYLTGDAAADFVLTPGMLVRLTVPDDDGLTQGCADVRACVDPADLPALFPYPDVHGTERRPRPAYYYSQSAVLPYRQAKGELEVLVITSSKKNHWVVPKGIHDPGLTAQQSAAKEAEEEAGVFGAVDDAPLGRYRQEKWGGECTVVVYPMHVTSMVPAADWNDSYRERRWVAPEAAAAQLKSPELADLVRRFAARHRAGAV